ncbi:hypothetical protein HU200_041314 [Digitaria exilis]|uniref:Manganese-dependent ADP-ribose/CDP-alcohol diphosphatase n=1 Tax=Digitaria exilis TaxID=1010633 RepID=A0A835EHA9_9POAL|nr:hypothetical protein HU200_041314 [Digitaria exilis]
MGAATGAVAPRAAEPLFSFGVIADVQYADIPDGRSFHGVPRYYRHSLAVLQRAVARWNATAGVKFAVSFGDIVDGHCPRDRSLWAARRVIAEFDKFRGGPTYHMIGNHCLYNLPRSDLLPLLRIPTGDGDGDSGRAYYDFSPFPGFRVVVLDAYDVSALGWPQGHPAAKAAAAFLMERNPNEEKNSSDGLAGVDRRFVKYNGAVGEGQLAWLDGVLGGASARGESVVVCSHLPMDPGAAYPESLMWNYGEVMAVVHRHGCVRACLAGHDHSGGYSVDSRGVHHRALRVWACRGVP